ncbi:methyltransferase [Allochromatium tepidum]|uniref:Methyltransferase n=2 Tax=Allochromatium tepidum TaxID=553982 RepID=A0ABN6GF93_9GAMM|nr:methyltransferase [Allochromatium tepidum]
MTDWTAGYVTEIDYTHGYYAELNPLRAQLALAAAGFAAPAGFAACCELGFGQGLSVNIHAAAGGAQWFATDFNPAQAGFAQWLAAASGARAALFDEAFADFCARTDLPDFDYIGLHGIWSWISDENRAVIANFVRRKLKVGGVLYVSYNCQPGWAAFVPLRDLLVEHHARLTAAGRGVVPRIDESLAFAERLFATSPLYARANPQVPERLKKIGEQNRHYLAHEYFNRDWHPMSVARMAEWLAPAKLQFAASAHLLDAVDAVNLTAEQQALLQEIPDPVFRQLVRDFCVNQQFRRDYWVKGARRLTPLTQAEALRAVRLVLVQPRGDVALKVTGALGEATLTEAVYAPILDALADHKPKTLGELEQALAPKVNFGQLVQAALVLTGAGVTQPAQDKAAASNAQPTTKRLDTALMNHARGSNDIAFLASPVTGGGLPVNRFEQLFLLAKAQGKANPPDWAAFAWQLLAAQGQRLVKEGKALETAEENLAELTAQAESFAQKRLPLLRALMVA